MTEPQTTSFDPFAAIHALPEPEKVTPMEVLCLGWARTGTQCISVLLLYSGLFSAPFIFFSLRAAIGSFLNPCHTKMNGLGRILECEADECDDKP